MRVQEREAAEAQAELERRAADAAAKEEEARQLEEELRRTRIEMEEKQQALQEALSTPQQLHVHDHDDDDDERRSHSTTALIESYLTTENHQYMCIYSQARFYVDLLVTQR